MKRVFLSRTALLVVMAAVLLTWEAKAQDPPTPCQTADVLRQTGHYKEARDEYVKLLKSNPGLACAEDAFKELPGEQAAQFTKLGRVYQESGRPDLARDKYVEALRVDPTFEAAWQALRELGPLPTEDQEPLPTED